MATVGLKGLMQALELIIILISHGDTAQLSPRYVGEYMDAHTTDRRKDIFQGQILTKRDWVKTI